MENDKDEACCGNCRFFKDLGVGKDKVTICAEDSPTVTHVLAPEQGLGGIQLVWKSFSGWPITQEERWCGKHQRVRH